MGQFQQEPYMPPAFAILSININYLLLGLYGWEYVLSFRIEWALIRKRLAFRPSLIPYTLGRLCLLIYLILVVISTSSQGSRPPPSSGLACLPGEVAISLLSGTTLGCSSTNFLVRTWLIWKDSRLVHALLLVLSLGQWTMLLLNVLLTIRSAKVDGACQTYFVYPEVSAITIMYTTLLDFLVLVLSVWGLSTRQSRSPLKNRLRSQGILYFAVAGIGNIPATVASLLHNIAAFYLAATIGGVISTVAASWAVRSLHALDTHDPNGTLNTSDLVLTTQIEVPEDPVF